MRNHAETTNNHPPTTRVHQVVIFQKRAEAAALAGRGFDQRSSAVRKPDYNILNIRLEARSM